VGKYKSELVNYNNRLIELKCQLNELEIREKEYKDLTVKRNELSEKENLLNLYLKAVSPNGIPMKLLENVIPVMEDEVNNVLRSYVDFVVELNITKKQEIEIMISYAKSVKGLVGIKKWDVKNCSGFEKFVIDLAFRMVLQKISNCSKTSFLAIDEGFSSMDKHNLANIDIIFDIMRLRYDFVLVVSHIESLRDYVNKSIDIIRKGDFSQIL